MSRIEHQRGSMELIATTDLEHREDVAIRILKHLGEYDNFSEYDYESYWEYMVDECSSKVYTRKTKNGYFEVYLLYLTEQPQGFAYATPLGNGDYTLDLMWYNGGAGLHEIIDLAMKGK